MKTEELDRKFDSLVEEVLACTTCARMCSSKRVLNRGCGSLSAHVLVIGEAPGRLGADASELPFHGDKAGHNFEALIEIAGLGRESLFITNAVLCNPKDEAGNNSTPSDTEISQCARFLRRQIDLVDPSIVVTLGATALRAISFIEPHKLALRTAVRTASKWYGRELIPLYHPGQRAMIHRSFANQTADYQFLSERINRQGRRSRPVNGQSRPDIAHVASEILKKFGTISYFSLHKLAYLVEYAHARRYGHPLTGAYYIRQKDGPYCVDLHPQKLKRAGVGIDLVDGRNGLMVSPSKVGLFSLQELNLTEDIRILEAIEDVYMRYANLSDARLKTAVYLTAPMRDILRRERSGSNQFNAPISF